MKLASLVNPRRWRQLPRRFRRRAVILRSGVTNEVSWLLGGKEGYRRGFAAIAGAKRWCFLVGCNNSGTSVLQRILAASPEVSTFEFEGQLYCRLLRDDPPEGSRRLFTEYADQLTMDETAPHDHAVRLVHDLLRNLPEPGAPVVLEKTPANLLRMRWLDAALPDVRFVGLVRNGYAVSEGIRRKAGQPLERAARHWSRANEILLENGDLVRRFHLLTYETLTDDTERAARELADFLDIDPAPLLRAASATFSMDTVEGAGPRPLKNMNGASLARLSAADKRAVESEAAAMLARLGYSEDAP